VSGAIDLEQYRIDKDSDATDTLFWESMWPWLTEECDRQRIDPGTAVFSIWVSLTYMLASQGWPTAELMKEVQYHAQQQIDYESESET